MRKYVLRNGKWLPYISGKGTYLRFQCPSGIRPKDLPAYLLADCFDTTGRQIRLAKRYPATPEDHDNLVQWWFEVMKVIWKAFPHVYCRPHEWIDEMLRTGEWCPPPRRTVRAEAAQEATNTAKEPAPPIAPAQNADGGDDPRDMTVFKPFLRPVGEEMQPWGDTMWLTGMLNELRVAAGHPPALHKNVLRDARKAQEKLGENSRLNF